jgi:hypothetical protein
LNVSSLFDTFEGILMELLGPPKPAPVFDTPDFDDEVIDRATMVPACKDIGHRGISAARP